MSKSNNMRFYYIDKSYFFLETIGKEGVKTWIPTFKRYNKRCQNTPYCLYIVNVSKT